MSTRIVVKLIAGGIAAFNLAIGLWALAAPESFFDSLATFHPYNHHFLHDVGAFQAAMGALMVVALMRPQGMVVAFAGNAIAGLLHLASHIADQDLGGRPTDPFAVGLIAAAAVLGLLLLLRQSADGPT